MSMNPRLVRSLISGVALVNLLPLGCEAADFPYQACPLLRAYYPAPVIDKSSTEIRQFNQGFQTSFDNLVETGFSEDFGTITPNTTSFSVILFSGGHDTSDDPVIFEYSYTAPEAHFGRNVSSQTAFPLGTLTQLFTVFTWLVEIGDTEWQSPITKFLPELKAKAPPASNRSTVVDWEEVTVGALASQMSGIVRSTNVCKPEQDCSRQSFIEALASSSPYFMPDTTPIISNAAFQLLAFALQSAKSDKAKSFADSLTDSVLDPLGMDQSGLISPRMNPTIFGDNQGLPSRGEQAALSMFSTTADLAKAGHAMLTSKLLSSATTRRWLQPVADTSNLRNGVGRPWEIYHAGKYANSSILDVYTKAGEIGNYASYFGLSPDFDVGFAILAHDTVASPPDLNVYADIVSGALETLGGVAVEQMLDRYAGNYTHGDRNSATLGFSKAGPGLEVQELRIEGEDVRAVIAKAAGMKLKNLDFRIYPTNVADNGGQQWISVFQDKSAPVDADTPTCITWMGLDSLGSKIPERFVFQQTEQGGEASRLYISYKDTILDRE